MSILTSLLIFVACSSEIDTKPAAEVKEVTQTKPEITKPVAKVPADVKKMAVKPVEPVLPEGAIALAPESKVEFIGAKVTTDHRGGFKTVTGYATVADGKINAVQLDIDMTSVYADDFPYADKFVSHLKDEDFFFIEQFPTASFKSTSIADGKITGLFDMRGVQKEITFETTISEVAPYTMKAEFTINRKLWGIEYAGKADNLIKDDVAIIANLTFK